MKGVGVTTTPLGICLKFMLGRGRPVCFQQPAAVTSMTDMKARSGNHFSLVAVKGLSDIGAPKIRCGFANLESGHPNP